MKAPEVHVGMGKAECLQTSTVFFRRAFKMATQQKRSLEPCPIESNALRLLSPFWPALVAVPSIRMEGRRTAAAIMDMGADRRLCNPRCRLALAALRARHITISVVATARVITASLAGMSAGARTTARTPGPATADNATRHSKETHREAPLAAARQPDARAIPDSRPATMADHAVTATAVDRVVEITARAATAMAMTMASTPTRIDLAACLRLASQLGPGAAASVRTVLAKPASRRNEPATQDDCAAPHITPGTCGQPALAYPGCWSNPPRAADAQ